MSLLIGVDLGTSETKAGLFDTDGSLLRLARCGYPIITGGEPGSAEQDPEMWWRAVCQTLREVAQDVPPGDLAALCVEGQGPSVVMLDGQGRPLYNAILWMDTRTNAERDELSKQLGYPVSPFAHVPMAMWLRRHQGQAFQQARWFLAAWDFVAFRLCGRPASSSLAYFQPFPPEETAAVELPEGLFPSTIEAGHPIDGLTPSAAEDTGLPAGLPVVAGVHDGISTFIGAGLVSPGRAADVNGTSGGLALCWNDPINERGIFSASWIHPGEYIVGGAMATLGKCVEWVRDATGASELSYKELIAEAVTTPTGADGLIFLPYLAGERAPIWDPLASGVFFGLTLNHRREHLVRSVLESVAYALRHVAEELVGAGARIDQVRVCGRQALSEPWNQIKADVLGLPVAVPRVREAALLGAAVLAGVGAGRLPDITEGANQMVRVDGILDPDPDHHRLYTERFDVYKRLYPDLRDAFHQLSEITRGGTGESAS
ncbi:FGGY-family carbohydrate kinase [Chloroflexota bacterium]